MVRRNGKITIRHGSESILLTGVLIVPEMQCNLFSCSAGFDNDGISTYLNDACYLLLPTGARVDFTIVGKHFAIELGAGVVVDEMYLAQGRGDDAEILHERLGHFSMTRINSALKNNSSTRFGRIVHDSASCAACMMNRNRKVTPKTSAHPTVYTYFGQRVSSDTAGPFPKSPGGFIYVVNFYDHFSKHVAIFFLRSHEAAEILDCLKLFVLDYKAELQNTKVAGAVDEWFSDNGPEFESSDIDDFCREVGTRRAQSPPYTATRNASAERTWGTLLRPTTKMIAHAGGDQRQMAL